MTQPMTLLLAQEIVARELQWETLVVLDHLIEAGIVEWVADPEVVGCYAMVLKGVERPLLVVYADGSWEEG